MRSGIHRRDILKAMGAAAFASSAPARPARAQPRISRMPSEDKDTPKICLGFYGTVDEAGMRRLKQMIWGSNWPVSDLGGDFGKQIELAEEYLKPFGPKVRDKVMFGNARDFYRRKPPAHTAR